MRSFLSGSLERISSGNLAESSYSFCFTMNYLKIHRSRSTRVAALTALKTNSRKEVSESFNVPIPTLDRWKREAQDAGTMGDGLGLARPAPRKIRSDAGQRKKVTPRMINTMKKKIDQNPGLTCNDLRASVPGLDEVSRRTVNDVILKNLGLTSRVAVKKPLLTPPQVAETDFIYTYLF